MKVVLSILLIALLHSCGVQQKLSASHKLSPGMTKADVETIMGSPTKSDFRKNVEEWHYCKTGMSADEFLALFFYEGKLIEKLNYTVTLADTRGATGSCEKFIKMGNYREPDIVVEIRMR
ncbi:MAG: outer membrane protein assembly factor BamE [Chitinophagaceae bacterium]|nr:outer membrane protein assembly factor BamE [Chitinophagaceae bacterium]